MDPRVSININKSLVNSIAGDNSEGSPVARSFRSHTNRSSQYLTTEVGHVVQPHQNFLLGYDLTREFQQQKRRLTRKFKQQQELLKLDSYRLKHTLCQVRRQVLQAVEDREDCTVDELYKTLEYVTKMVRGVLDDVTRSPKKNQTK